MRKHTAPQRDVLRARIALMAADGRSNVDIAAALGVSKQTVSQWRTRINAEGLQGLRERERPGAPRRIDGPTRMELIGVACEPWEHEGGRATPTLDEVRERALARGIVDRISRSHLHAILVAGDIRPHRVRQWLHSPDPDFRPKVNEICELYHNPPPGSVVLCIDEKTGMQAVERVHPDRDPRPGRDRRREFEYKRHGTQTLIAALDVHRGEVFGLCLDRRTGDDLEAFMEHIATLYSTEQVHVVWDNLNTHCAHQSRWTPFNDRHNGRFHFHYTPLHASWVNQIECWFGILGRRCLRNASFTSKEQLRAAVERSIDDWNEEPRPFRWTFRGYPLETGCR